MTQCILSNTLVRPKNKGALMSEVISFANYNFSEYGPESIYAIGQEAGTKGVIPEIAAAFDFELSDSPDVDNLGGLISRVGPAKELQENIGRVQQALGTNGSAADIARSWSLRSGLLLPVERSYLKGTAIEGDIELSVVTGGVRNWMHRRAQRLAELHNRFNVPKTLLVAGNREMKPSEGDDVEAGMTEADYLRSVVAFKLKNLGIAATVLSVDSGVGDEVMAQGASKAREMTDSDSHIVVVSNAGAWGQNAGQFRRALRNRGVYGSDFDVDGQQFFTASDSFPLGSGSEPTATHQNPFSALGQIARNAQEMLRQY